ncbi:MAG: alkaline ceramidase [Candidatus Metalachnospira sp.]|nr:alkaline ceramidase [Candidatus Metalachnospira sp.]
MNKLKYDTAKLGFAEVDITPYAPVETIGFGREDELSRGILHPLSAQISIWQSAENKCCLIAIDHIGFSKQHADQLRTEIGIILSISKDNVMLCFSHTHSAPNESIENDYFRFLCSQVKEGTLKATQNILPIKAVWSNTYSDIGVNRRLECSALDRRIGILKVVDAKNGELKLLLLRLSAHANVLKADNYLISPDYFGAVRDLLKAKYGCAVMLTQGASGNVAPKYYKSSTVPIDANDPDKFINSETALNDMAEEIFRQTDKVLSNIKPQNIERLDMYSIRHNFYADVPSLDEALEIFSDAKKYAGIDGTSWLAEVNRLNREGIKLQTETVEIQYFALNDGCLCGVPNEIMCEFALKAEKMLHCDTFYLGGYTNGCTGYFPTEEEYDKGGYEVYWSMLIYYIYHGRVSSLNRNSASELIETAIENYKPYKNN